MPINAEACLSLPVNQSVDYAKQDTHIAQACALGGSTKLSEGGFVLVSVEAPAGAPIVHGVHAVIWALDLMAQNYPALEIRSAKVRFARFIYLDSPIELRLVQRTQTVVRFELTTLGQGAVFVALDLSHESPKSSEPGVALDVPEISTTAESPNEPTFEELSGLNGRLVQTMSDGLELRFPHLAKVITAKRLGGLAQLSKLVGMISPGLHSIFASFNVDFVEDPATTSGLRFRSLTPIRDFGSCAWMLRAAGWSGKSRPLAGGPRSTPPRWRISRPM